MTRMAFVLLCALIASESASAATASGSSALALAALVAANSRLLTQQDRSVMARMFAGYLNFRYPANRKITIKAELDRLPRKQCRYHSALLRADLRLEKGHAEREEGP